MREEKGQEEERGSGCPLQVQASREQQDGVL